MWYVLGTANYRLHRKPIDQASPKPRASAPFQKYPSQHSAVFVVAVAHAVHIVYARVVCELEVRKGFILVLRGCRGSKASIAVQSTYQDLNPSFAVDQIWI